MKKTLGLSQIVKNEAHVIERMLNSIKNVVDYITIVDTGSVDNTKTIIELWCNEHNIPFSIYDMPFTTFEECRNYAMEMSRDKTDYSFWLDADEVLVVDPSFDKSKLDKDIYMFTTNLNGMTYTRNEMWKNSFPFKWYGVVHEYITHSADRTPTCEIIRGLSVTVYSDGHSWTSDLSNKYRKHAVELEKYLNEVDNTDSRWVFFTAQSFHDSASGLKDVLEAEERLRRAMYYYKMRITMGGGNIEEIFFSKYRLSTIMYRLKFPFKDVLDSLLEAHSLDPLRAEPISYIANHYLEYKDYHNAHLYATAGYELFHGKNPYGHRILFIDQSLYEWSMLHLLFKTAYMTGRKEQAKKLNDELFKLVQSKPNMFPEDIRNKIINNKNTLK